jgi:hypothetical protein
MHNLFVVYFVNLYMFRAFLGPLSGGTTYVYNNWYVYNIWFQLIPIGMYTTIGSNPTRSTDSHLKRIISTNCCIHTVVPLDDGHR